MPGIDGRKMSKSYGNTIAMFAAPGEIKKAVMGIVTDSTPVEAPKDAKTPLFQLWALFASAGRARGDSSRARRRGGLGYGEVKKDLLARLLALLRADARAPRGARQAAGRGRGRARRRGATRARAIAAPVLAAAREAAGLGGRAARHRADDGGPRRARGGAFLSGRLASRDGARGGGRGHRGADGARRLSAPVLRGRRLHLAALRAALPRTGRASPGPTAPGSRATRTCSGCSPALRWAHSAST